jgi:SAM-dependent methyltransferase
MATREVARDFDAISPAYDATRDPLDSGTIDGLAERLRAGNVHSLLEVGVGTGRIARPLSEAGFTVTGIDASRGMLRQARAKGIARLVRGNAYRLPFPDGVFDAALFVHVLHLLDDPRAALTEAIRAGRGGVYALVHPAPPASSEREERPEWGARRTVYRILAERGYEVPRNGGGGPPQRERKILAELAPDRLDVVSDREVTEPVARSLRMIERGASRHTLRIPPEVLAAAVQQAAEEIGDRTFTYRRIESLAHWTRAPPPAPAP